MLFWLIAALLMAAAAASALWPLVSRPRAIASALDHDRAIYSARISEIDTDQALGRIGESEADAARAEEGRKLIAASAKADAGPSVASPSLVRMMMVAAVVAVPGAAVLLYLSWGSPAKPDMAIATRDDRDPTQQTMDQLVSRAEAHLAKNPGDARGWKVLAPIYLSMGRTDDAVLAWRKAVQLEPANSENKSSLAEALVASGQGVVTQEAKALFETTLATRPGDAKSRFYLAMALGQQGDLAGAEAAWRSLIADSPADAPWQDAANEQLNAILAGTGKPSRPEVGQPSGGPTQEDIEAAGKMSPDDRMAMIKGMVSGLAGRLESDPSDKAGWLKLIRAYLVLGNTEKALGALGVARKAHGTDAGYAAELATLEAEIKKAGSTQ